MRSNTAKKFHQRNIDISNNRSATMKRSIDLARSPVNMLFIEKKQQWWKGFNT